MPEGNKSRVSGDGLGSMWPPGRTGVSGHHQTSHQKEASQSMSNARVTSFPGLNHVQTSRAAESVLTNVTKFLKEATPKVGEGC